jgi:hypothetical protein
MDAPYDALEGRRLRTWGNGDREREFAGVTANVDSAEMEARDAHRPTLDDRRAHVPRAEMATRSC